MDTAALVQITSTHVWIGVKAHMRAESTQPHQHAHLHGETVSHMMEMNRAVIQ